VKARYIQSLLLAVSLVGCCYADDRNRPEPASSATIYPFFDGTTSKWGYLDRAGKVVVSPAYSRAGSFVTSDGSFNRDIAVVENGIGNCGYIGKSGQIVIPVQFAYCGYFSEGLAEAQPKTPKNADFGYISETGEFVIRPQFGYAGSFVEGVAPASLPETRKCGYIDKRGAWVLLPIFERCESFSEGLAIVRAGDVCGFINHKGDIVVPIRYEGCGPLRNGFAAVANYTTGGRFLAKTWLGRLIVRLGPCHPINADAYDCAWEPQRQWTIIRPGGASLLQATFDRADSFSEGLAAVGNLGGIGFVDVTGKFVIPPKYSHAERFIDGFAVVGIQNGTLDQLGIVDKQGNFRTFPRASGQGVLIKGVLINCGAGIFRFDSFEGGVYGTLVFDSRGEVVWPINNSKNVPPVIGRR
jgi:WG repeat protein